MLSEHHGELAFDRDLAVTAMQRLDDVWGMLIDKTQAQLVLSLVEQVTLYPDQMGFRWNQKGWETLLHELYRPAPPV